MENLITGCMAELVIDRLKVVNIYIGKGKWVFISLKTVNFHLHHVIEEASIYRTR